MYFALLHFILLHYTMYITLPIENIHTEPHGTIWKPMSDTIMASLRGSQRYLTTSKNLGDEFLYNIIENPT